ncbi:MAG TPA: cbb3-type cytochrome c oxidase N-terminal domain-containing protein [Bacteroidia bacterium]|jgi:cytochrome c oxidase cbb3-type subunit 3|nr:cbb3-type cytochrome c oxidase N-terminal domain-containing protein [Bacteroidia bacterium]
MSTSKSFRNMIAGAVLLLPGSLLAQQAGSTSSNDSIFSNTAFDVMLSVIVLLFLIIVGFAELVKGAARFQLNKQEKGKNDSGKTLGVLLLVMLLPLASYAQTAASVSPGVGYWGMGAMLFYIMLSVIIFECIIIYMLFWSGNMLLNVQEKKMKKLAAEKVHVPSFMEKLNASVAVADEQAIMLDHDYDGIRELDNDLPPWWKYGFYATVVFAVIYLVHFEVLHTGPSSLEEYQSELKEGEQQVAEYKKSALNLIDETTVTRLMDAASLAEGKAIFQENCVACHGDNGEGKEGLGPNFCDDYWLHGGSINSVFKSIKYGWTDKGMKSWQQDLKPSEIQLVASFVKSLRGTNPPNPKEKQGDYYVDPDVAPLKDSAAAPKMDSAAIPKTDSAK